MAASAGAPVLEAFEERVVFTTLPLVTIAASAPTVLEDTDSFERFIFHRTGNLDHELKVNFVVANPSANGVAYTPIGTSITIPAGRRTERVPLVPINDFIITGDKPVTLTIIADAAYRLPTHPVNKTATITIIDDDRFPVVTLSTPSPTAAEIGREAGQFVLRRTGPTDLPLDVDLRVSGSATPGADYDALPTHITFVAGQRTMTFTVMPHTDTLFEGDETVRLTILPAPNIRLAVDEPRKVSTWVVIRDRPLVTIITVDPLATSFPADTGAFRIARTGPLDKPLRVSFLLDGSAVSGTDYVGIGLHVIIPAGDRFATITIRGRGIALSGPKTVHMTLQTALAYNLDPGAANAGTITIIDDTVPPGP